MMIHLGNRKVTLGNTTLEFLPNLYYEFLPNPYYKGWSLLFSVSLGPPTWANLCYSLSTGRIDGVDIRSLRVEPIGSGRGKTYRYLDCTFLLEESE